MAASTIHKDFRAWQYTTRNKPFESNLDLTSIPMLKTPSSVSDKAQCVLVRVYAASINPADYKVPTTPVLGYFLPGKKPATPGLDYAGVIVEVPKALEGKLDSGLKVGDRVIGRLDSLYQHGTLAEYLLGQPNGMVKLPAGVSFEAGAALGTGALSALQPMEPHLRPGDSVFINGGSGGVGSFTTQIAKLLGAGHVTVTCGPANVERVRSLGADEVINYRDVDVMTTLKASGRQYDLIIENVGANDSLYEQCHHFLKPSGRFVQVAGTNALMVARRAVLPGFLGGGKRKYQFFLAWNDNRQLGKCAEWLGKGEMKAEINEVFPFEKVKEAYEKLAGGRAKGKIVVKVAEP